MRLLRLCGGDSDSFVQSQRFVHEIQLTLERGHGSTWCASARAFLTFHSPRPAVGQLAMLFDNFGANRLPNAVAFWNAAPTSRRQLDEARLATLIAAAVDRADAPPRWQLLRNVVTMKMLRGAARRERVAPVVVAPARGELVAGPVYSV